MDFTSIKFLLYVVLVAVLYYAFPKKARWLVLLASSVFYYYISCGELAVWILITCITIYIGTQLLSCLQKNAETQLQAITDGEIKKKKKKSLTRAKKWVVAVVIIINFMILGCTKYAIIINGIVNPVMNLLSLTPVDFTSFLMPLGISFYTFQSIGYLIDVYRGKSAAEKNPLKLLLFLSFFPQIVQGPISRWGQLSPQLLEGNKLQFENIKNGSILIGCGLIKKLVFADRLYVLVDAIFKNSTEYGGAMMFLGSVLYGFQIYGDFSGGIDVTIGVARILGIEMTPNFKQPNFAISTADFWRRWHISLGAWMRDYLFYPLSMSKLFTALGKKVKKRFGARWNRVFISGVISFIVFTVVGIWHGAEAKYLVYGFYNGLLIMLATMFEPVFEQWSQKCHVDRNGNGWQIVRIVRTFILVAIGRCIVRADNVELAFSAIGKMFTDPAFGEIALIKDMGLVYSDFIILAALLIIIFVVGVINETTGDAIQWLNKKSLAVRWAVYYAIIFILILFLPIQEIASGGFIYGRF